MIKRTLLLVLVVAPCCWAAIAEMTRQDILKYGETAIGSNYVWGGSNWDPADRDYGGADCSGYVGKCWALTRWTPYPVSLHPYATFHYIQTPGPYWDEVDRGEMLYGDAIVYRYADDSGGHTYLYLSGDGWGDHEVYEARGTAYGIVHRWRAALSTASVTKGIRRDNLLEVVDVTEHIIETDDGAPYYTDSGMTGNSSWDSHAYGCQEGQGRYRWMSSAGSQTCTYQPDLPEAGWYRLYVTVNTESPNVHDVGVTVHHANGSERFLWDQASADSINLWKAVADQSFYFEAGTDGTVVWDNFDAYPIDSEYVFRGDATKWVLENRVEVDGIGAEPGKFATLTDAVAWLKTHASEEPDIINITCDTLVEPGCVVIDMIDTVIIDGDADGNGVPVTIAVNPTQPSDWDRNCAIYLDIPIMHHYTLRDLTLVPVFETAGSLTQAYAICIDEKNPSNDACAWELDIENVTIAGSLPGNIASSIDDDAAQLTRFGGTDLNLGGVIVQKTSEDAGSNSHYQWQNVRVRNLTILHSATRGVAIQDSKTDWKLDGLTIQKCGLEGVRIHQVDDCTVQIGLDSSVAEPSVITNNLGSGIVHYGVNGDNEDVSINRCILTGNESVQGSGFRATYGDTRLTNCLISDNLATSWGGGIFSHGGLLTIEHCTIANNTAVDAGGIYNTNTSSTISHSIVWGNEPSGIYGAINTSWSNLQDGPAGTENISRTPVFADAFNGDYALQPGSPCINVGNPAGSSSSTDLANASRPQCGRVDLGAYESSTWNGDADQDGELTLTDWLFWANCINGPDSGILGGCELLDLDGDGDVDIEDASRFQTAYPAGS